MGTFTRLYLTNRAADYTPATNRGVWSDTAGAVTKALDSQKRGGGANANVARAEANASNTYAVLLYRGVSGPLAAQTINCNVNVCIGVKESNVAADMCWRVHLYATQGNSDTLRVTLLDQYVETTANELPTVAAFLALAAAQAVNQAVQDGDRLVLEVGVVARNAVTTSYTATLYYGCNALDDGGAGGTDVTTKAGFISFSSPVTEGTVYGRATQVGSDIASTLGTAVPARLTQVGVDIAYQMPIVARLTQVGVDIAYVPPVAPPAVTQRGRLFLPV